MHLPILSLTIFAAALYLPALAMNVARKNTTMVMLYVVQSLAVAFALLTLSWEAGAEGLLYAALLTIAVKVFMAPVFLLRLIKRYGAHFSSASYLNLPLSLLALAAITAFSYSTLFSVIPAFNKSPSTPLLIASVFSVLFLMINRRGAIAGILGILALENAVVLLAAFLGIEHSFALEFAITFDIAVWISIAAAFLTMMYRHFGDIDTAILSMTRLTED